MDIARKFVSRVGPKLAAGPKTPDERPESRIPVGETLLMKVLVGEDKIPLNFDVLGIKTAHGARIGLGDFTAAADLAIEVDADSGTASGWFIRESQDFNLDLDAGEVTIKGETRPLPADAAIVEDGEIYVDSAVLGDWFGMSFDIDYQDLKVQLATTQPLPAEERHARRNRRTSIFGGMEPPRLPRRKTEYKAFSVPFVDVNVLSTYRDSPNTDTQFRTAWSALGSGDLAYLNSRIFVSGYDESLLDNLRLTFGRESEDAELLGPLRARSYSFGDVHTAQMPLTGSTQQELGFHVTNRLSNVAPSQDTIDLRGDAQPGWDVELYRNESLIGFQQVDQNGQYLFEDVRLFLGDNDMKLIFYGPQGEVREEVHRYPVTRQLLSEGGTYDVSLTASKTETYRAGENDPNDPEEGKPHLAARYDVNIGEDVVLNAGLRTLQEDNDHHTYVQSGITTTIGETLVGATVAGEIEDGDAAVELTARRSFGRTSLRAKTQVNTDGYNPGGATADPVVVRNELSLTGPFEGFMGFRGNYNASADFTKQASGAYNGLLTGAATVFHNGKTISNSLTYQRTKTAGAGVEDFVRGALNMRGYYKRMRWRALANYDIVPETDLRTLYGSVAYPLTDTLDGQVELEHNLNPSRTELTGLLNWQTEKATISPRLSIDTDDVVQAYVNVNFGVGQNPRTGEFNMFGRRIADSGAVSARVFLDTNGNGVYDEGEELIEGVEVEAKHAYRTGTTDETGIAFITGLQRGLVTDITIDTGTLADPYWMPTYEGISVRPRPGAVNSVDFPVVVSGEIDGTVSLRGEDGKLRPARLLPVHLVDENGEIAYTAQSAYDGFYVFSNVKPGGYALVVDAEQARKNAYNRPQPVSVVLEPEGTTLYGVDLVLNKGDGPDYRFMTRNGLPVDVREAVKSDTYIVDLGGYTSDVALSLAHYRMKLLHGRALAQLELLQDVGEVERSAEDNLLHLYARIKSGGADAARDVCVQIATGGLRCTLVMLNQPES